MGLKTTNYVSKSTGLTLPNAYAVLGDLVVNRHTNNARAVFIVQASRESAKVYKPLDEVTITFVWDRKSNVVEQAYEEAKKQIIDKYDELGNVLRERGVLFGWQDDIVKE